MALLEPEPIDVAVIIVNYRSAEMTLQALASLQAERAAPGLSIRAIVVDNASGDGPLLQRAIEERGLGGWVELLVAPRNGGFAYGNNRGIERAYARGAPAFVYLLNPDAQIRPGAIGTLVDFLQAHPAVGIVGGSFENADGSDWPIAFRFPSLQSELLQGLQLGVLSRLMRRWEVPQQMDGRRAQPIDWVSGASMLIRPAVFETIGGMDENYFLYFEETDFCRRARQAGFETWYVPASRVMHIGSGVTKVNEHSAVLKRKPDYWFASRRRYFLTSFGPARAMWIDVVALLCNAVGVLQRALRRRSHRNIPHFTRDLARSSILWRRNRQLPPAQCYLPSRAAISARLP
jgi:GT2 family glycosyltransferase